MKICFLVNDLRLSGGVGVVVRHAITLSEDHDFDVTIAIAGDSDIWDHYPGLEAVTIAAVDELDEQTFDIAIGTWWDTTYHLFSMNATHYAYFIQSLEDRFYGSDDIERAIAGLTFDLPVTFITEAEWIRDTLKKLRPECTCFYVRNGIDKTVFDGPQTPQIDNERPLRVLVEGHPEVWFKAIDESFAALAAMREPKHVTFVSPDIDSVPTEQVDRAIASVSHREMAALYEESDVVLKLSRVEGMFGPPLEGFHMGATCVVTPVTGYDEYVVHNWNGIVTEWDDVNGTARFLDLLARDRRFLHFLRWNALKTAENWPSWKQSTEMMALALDRLNTDQPTAERELGRQMAADIWGTSTQPFRRMRSIELERDELLIYRRRYNDIVKSRAYKLSLLLRRTLKTATGRSETPPTKKKRRLLGK